MRPVGVRSDALLATAARLEALADEVRDDAHALAVTAARARPPPVRRAGDLPLLAQWAHLEGETASVVGPGGAWGEGARARRAGAAPAGGGARLRRRSRRRWRR